MEILRKLTILKIDQKIVKGKLSCSALSKKLLLEQTQYPLLLGLSPWVPPTRGRYPNPACRAPWCRDPVENPGPITL